MNVFITYVDKGKVYKENTEVENISDATKLVDMLVQVKEVTIIEVHISAIVK